MNNQIQIGDLVRVAQPKLCCGSLDDIGFIFTVASFVDVDECGVCHDDECRIHRGKAPQ